jgi:hypothetical protein
MLVGTYAVRGVGTVFSPVPGSTQPVPIPNVYVGVASIDYSGRGTATFNGTIGGVAAQTPVTFSVNVASDCTAALSYTVTIPGTGPVKGINRWIITDNGNTIYSIWGTMEGAAAVGSETIRRISYLPMDYMTAETPCTADMFHGSYVYRYDGNLIMMMPGATQPTAMPFYSVGSSSRTNTGASWGKGTANIAGSTSSGVWTMAPGGVQVNANCTGTANWSFPDGTSGTDAFVILDGGREFWTAMTILPVSMGLPAVLGTYKRTSDLPIQ